jgi:hypothetical protein
MMSKMLGAPLGGTTRGGHQGFDWAALGLMTPPNFGSGGGSWLPGMVVVASGEPSTPVTCGVLAVPPGATTLVAGGWAFLAKAGNAARSRTRPAITHAKPVLDGRCIFSFFSPLKKVSSA